MTEPVAIVMPRLSDSMEEGVLLRWLKGGGELIAVGDELAEIESDKATMVYEAETSGVLTTAVAEGETVQVGAVIAWLGDSPSAAVAGPLSAGEPPAVPMPRPGDDVRRGALPAGTGARPKASPIARRMALTHGIDLTPVAGSGPQGRITRQDVTRLIDLRGPERVDGAEPVSGRGPVTVQPLARAEALVAERMAQSRREIPEFEVSISVDAEPIVALRAALKADALEAVPSVNDFIVAAAGRALQGQPRANGEFRDDGWRLYGRVNVGIAVATDQGLVVPTIFDADRKPVGEIARVARDLAARARKGLITPAELDSATFTISNLGMFGVDSFSAIIPAHQAAILAVGAVLNLPVVRDGAVVPGMVLHLALCCDHRILYGAHAAALLSRIRELLEHPYALLV